MRRMGGIRVLDAPPALSTEQKLRSQGSGDWWHPLLNDERRTPDEALLKLQDLLRASPDLVKHRGVFGETVLHACVLGIGASRGFSRRKMAIAKRLAEYLVETYNPASKHGSVDLVNAQYDTCHENPARRPDFFCETANCIDLEAHSGVGLYRGETALHMSIVSNLPKLERLLIKHEANLCLRAIGNFFIPGGNCYFGETPLNFAVSQGRLDAVELLVTTICDSVREHTGWRLDEEVEAVFRFVTQTDSIGNNALHMCVVHKHTSVLDYILNLYPREDDVYRIQAEEEELFQGRETISVGQFAAWLRGSRTTDAACRVMHQRARTRPEYTRAVMRRVGLVWEEGEEMEGWLEGHREEAVSQGAWRGWALGDWWRGELLYCQNSGGNTALTLAALQGDKAVFAHCLSKMFQVAWVFGPVGCFTLPLEQIDTLDKDDLFQGLPSDNMRFHSVLDIICTEDREALAVDTTVVALLEAKWDKWGKGVCVAECAWTLLNLLLMDLYCGYYVQVSRHRSEWGEGLDEEAEAELAREEGVLAVLRGLVFVKALVSLGTVLLDTVAALSAQRSYSREVIQACSARVHAALLADLGRLRPPPEAGGPALERAMLAATRAIRARERCQVSEFSKRDMFVFTKYTYAKMVAAALVVADWCLRPAGTAAAHTGNQLILLAFAAPTAHFTLLQFVSVASPQMGYLLIILSRALRYDFARFFFIWSVMALGFGVGLHLVNGVQPGAEGALYEQWLQLYRVTLGEKPEWGSTLDNGGREWVVLLFVFFTVFSSVVLIRMLIAMFNETYIATKRNAAAVWRIERGRFLILQERRTMLAFNLLCCFPRVQERIRNSLWISTDTTRSAACKHEFTMTQPLGDNSKFDTKHLGYDEFADVDGLHSAGVSPRGGLSVEEEEARARAAEAALILEQNTLSTFMLGARQPA